MKPITESSDLLSGFSVKPGMVVSSASYCDHAMAIVKEMRTTHGAWIADQIFDMRDFMWMRANLPRSNLKFYFLDVSASHKTWQ